MAREQGVVWATTAVEGGAAYGTALGDDKVEEARESISWSTGPAGRAIIAAVTCKDANVRPPVATWAPMASIKVNGANSGRGEDLSVSVRSVVS